MLQSYWLRLPWESSPSFCKTIPRTCTLTACTRALSLFEWYAQHPAKRNFLTTLQKKKTSPRLRIMKTAQVTDLCSRCCLSGCSECTPPSVACLRRIHFLWRLNKQTGQNFIFVRQKQKWEMFFIQMVTPPVKLSKDWNVPELRYTLACRMTSCGAMGTPGWSLWSNLVILSSRLDSSAQ